MTTETTTINQLPPCPLPDCEGGEHHFHDIDVYVVTGAHDCAGAARIGYRCYGPHRPQQWQPIERDQIRAGMRIRATTTYLDYVTTRTGVAHHTDHRGDWRTERNWPLTGWDDPTTYEVDPATIPADPDADLIEALREASWRIEHMGKHPDPIPSLPEARDLLNELRELGWTVIRAEEEKVHADPAPVDPVLDETDKRDRIDLDGYKWQWSGNAEVWQLGVHNARGNLAVLDRDYGPLRFADEETGGDSDD